MSRLDNDIASQMEVSGLKELSPGAAREPTSSSADADDHAMLDEVATEPGGGGPDRIRNDVHPAKDKIGSKSLRTLGRDIQQRFAELVHKLKAASSKSRWDVQDQSQNFIRNACVLGLFMYDHKSLDYRIQDDAMSQDYMREVLDDIMEILTDLNVEFGFESRSLNSVDKNEGSDEAYEEIDLADDMELGELDRIKYSLNSLSFSVGSLIRVSSSMLDPAREGGHARARNYTEMVKVDQDEEVDLMAVYQKLDMRQVKEYLRQAVRQRKEEDLMIDIPLEESATPDQLSGWTRAVEEVAASQDGHRAKEIFKALQKNDQADGRSESLTADENQAQKLILRLAKANNLRRRQFKVWQKLHQETVQNQPPGGSLDHAEGKAQDHAPRRTSEVAGTTATDPVLGPKRADSGDIGSFASEITITRLQKDREYTELAVPVLPEKLRNQAEFECPYCHFPCNKKMESHDAWSNHVLHDLRPYICTIEDCQRQELWQNIHTWRNHEIDFHPEMFKGQFISEKGSYILTNPGVWDEERRRRKCPFCYAENVSSNHVAFHLQRIALFALPCDTQLDSDKTGNRLRKGSSQHEPAEERSVLLSPEITQLGSDETGKRLPKGLSQCGPAKEEESGLLSPELTFLPDSELLPAIEVKDKASSQILHKNQSLEARTRYTCPLTTCSKLFIHIGNILNHYMWSHEDPPSDAITGIERRYICWWPSCEKIFGSVEELDQHEDAPHFTKGSDGCLQCMFPDCKFTCQSDNQSDDHYNSVHRDSSRKRYECGQEDCPRKGTSAFRRENELEEHQNTHHAESQTSHESVFTTSTGISSQSSLWHSQDRSTRSTVRSLDSDPDSQNAVRSGSNTVCEQPRSPDNKATSYPDMPPPPPPNWSGDSPVSPTLVILPQLPSMSGVPGDVNQTPSPPQTRSRGRSRVPSEKDVENYRYRRMRSACGPCREKHKKCDGTGDGCLAPSVHGGSDRSAGDGSGETSSDKQEMDWERPTKRARED